MESILWAMNLVGLVILCLWAIREDKRDESSASKKQQKP
jgi:hypothetical protein